MSLAEWKCEFENRKILIWGFGREGLSSYQLIRKVCPELVIDITESRKGEKSLNRAKSITTNTRCFFEDEVDFEAYDLILKSPGVVVPEGINTDNISGEAQLFLKHYGKQTIGITGTKGKSTTTTLTKEVLGKKYRTFLVGNIGIPCFDIVEELEANDLVAFEISCHQLEYCPYSPHFSVFLNLYEEHLDHYGSMEKYGNAKAKILLNQKSGDQAVIYPGAVSKVQDGVKYQVIGNDIYTEGMNLYIPGKTLEISDCRLIGDHNYSNLAVVYYIASEYGITDEQFIEAVRGFRPLHHRLEDLGEFEEVRFVNDSISTIGQSCIQAIESINDVDTVLIGGMDRGIEYKELEQYIGMNRSVKYILMYATGARIYNELKNNGLLHDEVYLTDDLAHAVELARSMTRPHHCCLLSPAASSYDHFKNFEERGEVFERLAFRK